jgi:uridine kinase
MTAIRKKLIDEINNASESTVKELYKLHSLVKQERNNNTGWLSLTASQKENIETSLQELNEGKGIPIKKAMAQLLKKHGLS